jgi:hypothetical protein
MRLFSISILVFLSLSFSSQAKIIAVFNNTKGRLEVVVIPKGIMGVRKKEMSTKLKSRHAFLKPKEWAVLRGDNLQSIDVKSRKLKSSGRSWYIYDHFSAQELIEELTSSDAPVILAISGQGDSFKVRTGRDIIRGQVEEYGKLWP